MIGMGMRNDSGFYRLRRVDIKIAVFAIQAAGIKV
jgi:hypothetical protein